MYYRTGLGPDTDKVNSLVVPRACLRDVLCAWVIPWAPTMVRQAPVATLSIPTADLPILGPPANQTFPWGSRTGNAQFPQLPRPASGARASSFRAGSWTRDSGSHDYSANNQVPPTAEDFLGVPTAAKACLWVLRSRYASPVTTQANMSAPGNWANSRTPQSGDSGLNSLTSKAASRYPKQESQQPATPAIELQMTFRPNRPR